MPCRFIPEKFGATSNVTVPELPMKTVAAVIQLEYETAFGEQLDADVENMNVPEFKPAEDTFVALEPSV